MASENLVQWNSHVPLSSMLETNCARSSSSSNFLHVREPNCNEHGKQIQEPGFLDAADNHVDALLHQKDKVDEHQMTVNAQTTSEGISCFSELEDLDKSIALWVKWKGKWRAGIRCARADCPLSTLKARPTHDPNKDFIVFFPHTRDYSWADMLLVCPINELPEPIAHGTHYQGLEKVKDLCFPRSFMLQKLAVGLLDIIEQLHNEAVIESARKVTTWKEFAMEASHCKDYSDLGRMLLKLQSMILRLFIDPGWLQRSFDSWIQRCMNAQSAEAVEMLKEELVDSILWNEIEALWDAPMQPELDSEWRTWKQEAMKWFSISHPIADGVKEDQQLCDDSMSVCLQTSRKRPKLEVRRAEMHPSQLEANALTKAQLETIASGAFDSQRLGNPITFVSESCVTSAKVDAPSDCPGSLVDRWDEIVVEAGNNEFVHTTEMKEAPAGGASGRNLLGPVNKSRQCQAFIEAKGRQCIRWANDGDNYCCVHLAIRSLGKTSKAEVNPPVDTPMCAGTTTHGMKCKHRSQYGSTFCKKHKNQNSQDLTNAEMSPNSPKASVKRSHTEMISMSGIASFKEIMVAGELQKSLRDNSVSVIERETLGEKNTLLKPEESITTSNGPEPLHCIGLLNQHGAGICSERAKFHTLYCEKHIPSFLKRARNGKTRIISKEIFIEFLSNCRSRDQKIHLHQACVLLHAFIKSVLSRRNPVSKEIQLHWILSEASKDLCTGEYIMKLVSREREKLGRLWNFDAESHEPGFSGVEQSDPKLPLEQSSNNKQNTVKCKICSEEFVDDQILGAHWMDIHKKEAQWLFRGYACAICTKSFTNKKVLENHVRETHEMQFHDHCVLSQCMPCSNHFMNPEQLWLHVLSVHSMDLKLPSGIQQDNLAEGHSSQKVELDCNDVTENKSESNGGSRRFICRFCSLKFDLLPDLGRHHQAAHKGQDLMGHIPPKISTNPYKLKSGRLIRPKFTKRLGTASYRIRNRANMRMKKRFQASGLASSGVRLQPQVAEVVGLGRLTEPQCSTVAKILFSEIQEAKPRPSNLDLLSVARSTCCKVSLHNALEEQFGVLPDRIYLKAAKLCSELNIPVQWHHEGFVCPKGCKPTKVPQLLPPLMPLSSSLAVETSAKSEDPMNFDELEMDECHYVIESQHIKSKFTQTPIVLCEDVSFGRESVPIPCVADENTLDSLHINIYERSNGNKNISPMPWESFTYATKRLLDPSTDCDTKGSQLGCACTHSTCSPDVCDHVYLFENDYEAAIDIFGEPMHGKFAYDEKGRIILEEGYLVYECNSMCSCDRTCQNRVLQNGVQVELEVFKTEEKGWGLRAREAIARGTFVCEYIGEVSNDQQMNKRGKRYEDESCCYLYKVDAHVDEMSGLDEVGQYVVDARDYGNVSRFINHSCLPNLVNYQVLVDSMDFQLAHIGFYASRDIAAGEELAYDYSRVLLSGGEQPCLCGAPNCRGRLP